MLSNLKSALLISSFALFSLSAFAEKSELFSVNGTIDARIPMKIKNNNINSNYDVDALNGFKNIKLMSIQPTNAMIQKNRIAMAKLNQEGGESDYSNGITSFDNSFNAVDLGMNGVDVLDQGSHGTCVTFATTAALDAKLQLNDYIDQQCILALNKNLGNDYWNGADNATQVVDPLKKYGIIKKGNCFGVSYAVPSQIMSPSKYTTRSTKKFSNNLNYKYFGKADLNILKAALDNGNRVVIGTALANIKGNKVSVNGFDVKVDDGDFNQGGLWACKQPGDNINYCPEKPEAGHEVIVVGYDDGQKLLKIRNSWSSDAGDNGNFYMTYAFFNAMAMDQTVIK